MNRKSLFFLILLCVGTFSLFFSSSEVSASWLDDADQLSFPGTFVNYDPSIDFDANGVLHYTFTQYLPENGQMEIGYFNNSAGLYFVPDSVQLSGGRGVNSPNTKENGHSDIAVDNEICHVVWQGRQSSGDDFEIYYTNNSLGRVQDYVVNLTKNSADDITPSVAAVDNYVFIVYYSADTTDLVLKTNYGGNSLESIIDPTPFGVNNDAQPKLSVWKSQDNSNWRVDLVYIDTGGNIQRTYILKGEDPTEFGTRAEQITASAIDLSVDSSETAVAVAYESSGNIYVADNSSFGSPTLITGAANVGNPDVIINENNMIQVFFSYNQSADESYIITTNNYNNNYNENFDYIIGQDQIPQDGVTGLHISSFDAEQCAGEGIFIIYDGEVKTDLSYERKILFLNSYINLYTDGTEEYNFLTWEDDLTGKASLEGWLIESMAISFNTSTGNDGSLKVRIIDNVTGISWENTSIFSGSGGNDQLQAFFQPDDYFIARNPMIVELLNGSTDQELVKIEIDPLLFSEGRYNYTSNYQENSSLFPYSLAYGEPGSGFEDTVFRFDIDNELEYRDTVGAQSQNAFDSTNHVDLYKFHMKKGEKYNMRMSTNGGGSEKWKLKIFNSTAQITNDQNALMVIDSMTYNDDYFQLFAEKTDDYYFVIENHAYGMIYDYTWEHHVCPLPPNITGPSGTLFTDHNSNFIKDINGNLFLIETNFTWENHVDETLSVDHYKFNIYDSLNQKVIPEQNIFDQYVELVLYGGDGIFPNYDLDDGIYYVNITSASSTGQLSHPTIKQFQLDGTPPEISEYSVNNTTPQYDDQFIEINCTVNDNSNLQWVYVSEDSTGIFKNRTMMLEDGNFTYLLDISHLNYGDIVKFSFHAKDIAGNMGLNDNGGLNYSIQIQDFYDPITSIDINFIREPNYISGETNITLFANDSASLGGSGASQIRYRIDNGGWKNYTGPFNLSGYNPGFHTIYYNSSDFAGNIENTNQLVIYLIKEHSESDGEDDTSNDGNPSISISFGYWSLMIGCVAAITVVNYMKSKYSL